MNLVGKSCLCWLGVFLAAVAALGPVFCKADEKVLLGLVDEVMKANPDAENQGLLVAAKIRQHYGKDEAALLRDAMDLAGNQDGYATLLVLLADVGISAESRLSLVEQIVTAKNDEGISKACLVLSKCDQVRDGSGTGEYQPDISRHRAWLKKGEALPAEYSSYLFAQNGEQAWELLGSGDAGNPQVRILSRLKSLAQEPDLMARRRLWLQEILPQFAEGLNFANPYDAAYLAWFIGRAGFLGSTTNANPKLVAALEKALPGYAGLLMGKEGIKLTRTTGAEAARWLATARDRISAK